MTTSHGRSGNLSENFFRNSHEFAVALKLTFLNLERLPFGVMSAQDMFWFPPVPRPLRENVQSSSIYRSMERPT